MREKSELKPPSPPDPASNTPPRPVSPPPPTAQTGPEMHSFLQLSVPLPAGSARSRGLLCAGWAASVVVGTTRAAGTLAVADMVVGFVVVAGIEIGRAHV